MKVIHFFHKGLAIGDDVGISHDFEKMNFHERLLDLFLVHFGDINDFHDILLFVLLVFDQNCIPETTLPNNVNLSIFFHLRFQSLYR